MNKMTAAVDRNTDDGRVGIVVMSEGALCRERSRQRREQDKALRLDVDRRMARVRRLQMIVGRALVEAGLEEEFDAAMRA